MKSASLAIGFDAGGTLWKLAVQCAEGARTYATAPAGDSTLLALATEVRAEAIGLTGGGALALRDEFPHGVVVGEFAAWCAGIDSFSLMSPEAANWPSAYLLVSCGSGTTIFEVSSTRKQRVASTSIGGATMIGLGRLLAGTEDFDELCALANDGDASRVDLQIADIYTRGGSALPASAPAAAFGKVPHLVGSPSAADLAAGIVRMIGEVIALMCAAAAQKHDVRHVLFGGSTLRQNRLLQRTLRRTLMLHGCETVCLDRGEYVGAVGAMTQALATITPSRHAGVVKHL